MNVSVEIDRLLFVSLFAVSLRKDIRSTFEIDVEVYSLVRATACP